VVGVGGGIRTYGKRLYVIVFKFERLRGRTGVCLVFLLDVFIGSAIFIVLSVLCFEFLTSRLRLPFLLYDSTPKGLLF